MQLEPVPHDGASEHLEESEVETQFFSTPPAPPRDFGADGDLPSQPPPIPRTNQLVMVATLAMLATAALVIPLTLIYGKSLGGPSGMLSHEGPFLPDSATYRQAIEEIEEPDFATDVLAATAHAGATEAVPATAVTSPAAPASATVPSPDSKSASTETPESRASVVSGPVVEPGASNDAKAAPQAESVVTAEVVEPPAAETQATPTATAQTRGASDGAQENAGKTAPAKPRARRRRGGLNAAFKLFNAGQFKAAERAARRAANRNPTRADAWLLLGAARDAQGNRAGAIAAYHVCSARAKGPAAMDCMRLAGGH